jgi:hypothetical protein
MYVGRDMTELSMMKNRIGKIANLPIFITPFNKWYLI